MPSPWAHRTWKSVQMLLKWTFGTSTERTVLVFIPSSMVRTKSNTFTLSLNLHSAIMSSHASINQVLKPNGRLRQLSMKIGQWSQTNMSTLKKIHKSAKTSWSRNSIPFQKSLMQTTNGIQLHHPNTSGSPNQPKFRHIFTQLLPVHLTSLKIKKMDSL